MIEAIVIILALGGIEFVLWLVDRRHQQAQRDLLEGILTELAILNQSHEELDAQRGSRQDI